MKKLLLLLLPLSIAHAQLSQEFKTYWFDGHAEINSYQLIQSRYGEQRNGKAVLIYVTEDFLDQEQVKANKKSKTTIPVLKSNRTKNFLTGIYPYSVMSSTFSSLRKKHPLLKTVASIQEWCGQSYLQLNVKNKKINLISHSYFEGEADHSVVLEEIPSEDSLWNLIRFNPSELPQGNFHLLPSLELIRMNHLSLSPVTANALVEKGNYRLHIPSLKRTLIIHFEEHFPHQITGWEEYYQDKGTAFQTKAKLIHSERRKYWQENAKQYEKLRTPFKLDEQ